jgi:hypothetical protein
MRANRMGVIKPVLLAAAAVCVLLPACRQLKGCFTAIHAELLLGVCC